MKQQQSVNLKLGQKLAMTPALQQAIRMLQLSTPDLQTEIQEALDTNLMLEREEEQGSDIPVGPEKQNKNDIPDSLPIDADWSDIYTGSAPPRPSRSVADAQALHDYQQASLHNAPTLHEHLDWQAQMQPFDATELEIAANLIDSIDERGYCRDYSGLEARLVAGLNVTAGRIQQVLTTIQAFDPPGVAARHLAECLALQLRQLDANTPGRAAALAIVDNDELQALADADTTGMIRRLQLPDMDVLRTAISLIHGLQPHPGDAYADNTAQYITPEVFATKHRGIWHVSLNPDIAPRLRINDQYMGLIKLTDSKQDRDTLKEHLREARFFLHSLSSRNDTLLRVARCIVEQQRAFLEYGEEAMQPLILKNVADALEMHESTVSRATSNKYMQTPGGVLELKQLFSGHVTTTDGGSCSTRAIQAMIQRMIKAERPGKPLSDNTIAQQLLDEGIMVARRTVAKYREIQNIPSSSQRRRAANQA